MTAKSRLSAQRLSEINSSTVPKLKLHSPSQTPSTFVQRFFNSDFFQTRVHKIHLLLIAFLGYIYVWHLFNQVYPTQIANLIVTDSYIPLQIGLFWGNFFLCTWAFQHVGKGIRSATYFLIFFALLLQQVQLTKQLIFVLLSMLTTTEILVHLYSLFLVKIKGRPSRHSTRQV